MRTFRRKKEPSVFENGWLLWDILSPVMANDCTQMGMGGGLVRELIGICFLLVVGGGIGR